MQSVLIVHYVINRRAFVYADSCFACGCIAVLRIYVHLGNECMFVCVHVHLLCVGVRL